MHLAWRLLRLAGSGRGELLKGVSVKRQTMGTKILGLLTVGLPAGPAGARAATLIVADGELIGATGIRIDGNLYDVEFGDGSCIELFDGCDRVSNFAFARAAAAERASWALLEQVFLDGPSAEFDSDSGLARGCGNDYGYIVCLVHTPFALGYFDPSRPDVLMVDNAQAYNWNVYWWLDPSESDVDDVLFQAFDTTHDHSAVYETWARWTLTGPAPMQEPGTLAAISEMPASHRDRSRRAVSMRAHALPIVLLAGR